MRLCALAAVIAGALLVTACGGAKVSNPFGSSDESTGFSSERLPEMGSADAPSTTAMADAPAIDPSASQNCPQVVAWPNERLLTRYASGHDGDAMSVIHRGEITKLSRECQVYGGRVVVKYGFAGRVLLGPKGKPGPVSLPVSIRAAGAYKETLATDKMTVTATVPPDKTVGYFSMVRQISLPVQVGTRLEDYKIFVAFK